MKRKMKKVVRSLGKPLVAVTIIAVVFVSITLIKNLIILQTAEKFVDEFYNRLQAKDYSYIYNSIADEGFKDTLSYSVFERSMRRFQQKLGDLRQRKRINWKLTSLSSGTYCNIQYATTRELGSTEEILVLKKSEGPWLLFNYNIINLQE